MKGKKNKVDGVRTNRGNWGVMRAESRGWRGDTKWRALSICRWLDLPGRSFVRSKFLVEKGVPRWRRRIRGGRYTGHREKKRAAAAAVAAAAGVVSGGGKNGESR